MVEGKGMQLYSSVHGSLFNFTLYEKRFVAVSDGKPSLNDKYNGKFIDKRNLLVYLLISFIYFTF